MSKPFARRITLLRDGIEIYPVESIDSGTFEFRDPQGNLAQTVQVEVVYGEQQHFFVMEEKCMNKTDTDESN